LTIVVLAACGSEKESAGTSTTAKGATTTTTASAGGDAPTTSDPLFQKFVLAPTGFCQAFSNYLTYVSVVAAPSVTDLTGSSTTLDPAAADTKAGTYVLAFAPSMAPTTEVLQGDAPDEILPVFKDFDAYNDAAVSALGTLGVDTDKLSTTLADELAAVDTSTPESFPTPDSVAKEAGIDSAKLSTAAAAFVKDHGTLEALFQKYADLADPSADRQKEIIAKYPCLATALGGSGTDDTDPTVTTGG
jgi:hypothetical protein